jgi:peptidoglycan/LPS O-acetylase OafA/YrhL
MATSTPPDVLTRHRRALPALTGVRFLAAFYVVLFHGSAGLERRFHLPAPLVIFLSNGYLAVGLFFLLSGFILSYTYDGQIEGATNRYRFWEARFARIYPVYLLSLGLAYPFATDLHLGSRFAVVAMVQSWNPAIPQLAGAWNYPAWTLSVEAFFYICFPFVVPWICRSSNRALSWMIAILLTFSIFAHTPVMGLGDWKQHASLLERVLPLPVLRLPEFLLGVMMGLRFLRSAGQPARQTARTPWVIYLAIVGTLLTLSIPLHDWVALVILPFSALVYELARGGSWPEKLLSTKIMMLLGGASYSVYLLRYPVASWMHVVVSNLPPRWAPSGELATPLILVLFSILVFQCWEEPARKTLRRWFANGRSRAAQVVPSPSITAD